MGKKADSGCPGVLRGQGEEPAPAVAPVSTAQPEASEVTSERARQRAAKWVRMVVVSVRSVCGEHP